MFARKKPYYHIDDVPKNKKRFSGSRRLSALLIVAMFSVGVYFAVLLQAPDLLINQASAATQTSEEVLVNSNQNFIKIERISLTVPFTDNSSSEVIHRSPERGNPEKGGNFIIGAPRFKLALTPAATIEGSPFYNLDKLQNKDVVNVYYNAKWYSYEVTKVYVPEAGDKAIEGSSEDARMTLFSTGTDGSPDGRVVVEASLVGGTKTETAPAKTPLL